MPIETVQVRGLEGVLDTLKSLPPEIVSKRGGPVRVALARAARLMQREVKGNLAAIVAAGNAGEEERSTGLLSANIVASRGRRGDVNGETYRVRVRNKVYPDQKRNRKRFTTAQNARLLEYGTEKRQPYPFIRPAFESKKQAAVDEFTKTLNQRVNAIIRKLDRAGAR